ncbi:putative P2Y purinoceptor 8-like, partial [Triplophysa rosa]
SAVNTSAQNCTSYHDLAFPLVPYMDCPFNRKYAINLIPNVFYILSSLGIVGNLWSLWTCLRPSHPLSIGSIGVLNLALCDLVYLASMGPWAVYINSDYHWKMGRSLCIAVKILYFAGLTSSTMFICAISTDRFLAIVSPLKSRIIRTPRNIMLVSLLLWAIVGLLTYFRYLNILYLVRNDGLHVCGAVLISKFRTTEATYDLLSYYSIQVSVPLLIIIPSYVKIIGLMKQLRQQWGLGNMQCRDKTIWLIALFIANFLVCWVPGQLLYIVAFIIFYILDNCNNTCWVAWVVNLLSEVSQIVFSLNACLDPFIFYMQQRHAELLPKVLLTNCCKLLKLGEKQESVNVIQKHNGKQAK